MIPAKEAKDMLYKMLSENFVSLQVRGARRCRPRGSPHADRDGDVLPLLSPTCRRSPRPPTTRRPAPSTSTP